MPIREYRCGECGRVVEQIEHPGQTYGVPICCGDVSMERIPTSVPAAPQFKGPGFYKTDYPK